MNIIAYLTPKENTFYLDSKSTIRQALEKYDYHKFTVIPLVDESGKYVATVSEGDILRFIKNHAHFDIKLAENTLLVTIEKYRPFKTLDINCTDQEIIMLSMEQNFIPIIDDRGMYIGIIKRKDVIRYLYKKYPMKKIVK